VEIANASPSVPLTRGLIWMEDVHYNAGKYTPGQENNTFGWDNVGFDGPILPRDRGFDVPDNTAPGRDAGSINTGWNWSSQSDSVQTLLSKIDQITGTSTPSTIVGGVITLNTPNAANFSITSSPAAALASLGFTGAQPITATQPPLRVNGPPFSTATSLVNGSANTVAWYTGNSGPGSPRSTSTVQIDGSQSVQFGAQANEQAIRQQLQGVAVFAAVTFSPTGTNSSAQAAALSSRIATNLTSQPGQQTIADIQTDFAAAQTQMQAATARQTQTQTQLQNLVDSTETISTDQVASQILQLQTTLSASYQTTSILAGLSLTKFLVPGG